jgi:hypothetical protein
VRAGLSLTEDVRVGVLVVVSMAGMCWSLYRLAPGSLVFTVPLCVAALILLFEKGA